MQTRFVDGVTIRTLRNGDTDTVAVWFDRLGCESRRRRFAGVKPRLSDAELELLARVDGERHVLVAWLPGETQPAGIAHLAREGASGEFAVAVADEHQGRGIGRVLADEMAAIARAAGIRELRATVAGDNPPALKLLRRARFEPSGEFVVAL
ncbi:MAG: GNAT family N-acetyltransferase [Actinobacteria bacterium]|nr:GNAT family N-acetyltransferase [Actinomycetota bacterium]MBV8561934.1 GNAT family N-acetyltransferase [Actinomycetota bacterium]